MARVYRKEIMISPELLRRYPVFVGLSHENLVTLANTAKELSAEEGHMFFYEGEELHEMFIVMEGAVGIVVEVPAQNVEHSVADQLTSGYETEHVVLSAVGPGEVFGWSGLVPPYESMAGAKALTSCRVIVFDCLALLEAFKADCRFGFLMMEKTAQVIRGRLRDQRMESLAQVVTAA